MSSFVHTEQLSVVQYLANMVDRTIELSLEYRLLPASDVPKAYSIESAEYPESEAASLENLIYRQRAAPHLFLGCYARPRSATSSVPDSQEEREKIGVQHAGYDAQGQGHQSGSEDQVLVGYIVSTQSSDTTLTHSSMSSHDPQGTTVCIHSVCVARGYQRRGIATAMLKEYVKHLSSNKQSSSDPLSSSSSSSGCLKLVLLIAHDKLIGLYQGAGFKLVGLSTVEHGPDPWYEMVYQL